jgi:acetyl esterase/lipase
VFALVLLLLLPWGVPALSQELGPVARWATIAATEFKVFPNLVYSKANNVDLKLDVITAGPKSELRPTIIYFHSGGWLMGAKEQSVLSPLPFLAKGFDVVNVEYRLSSVSLAPAAVEDCRCALRWVYRNAKEYGFDTTKLVLEGRSAGGHLSLMTGMLDSGTLFDSECPGTEDLKVAAIVNYSGLTDLADMLANPDIIGKSVVQAWLGAQPNRTELIKQLSPLSHVRKGVPPTISLHGDKDPRVHVQEAVRFHAALDNVGGP